MNKIKNIYRTLILLLSLVLMPVEGWASDDLYVKKVTLHYHCNGVIIYGINLIMHVSILRKME